MENPGDHSKTRKTYHDLATISAAFPQVLKHQEVSWQKTWGSQKQASRD